MAKNKRSFTLIVNDSCYVLIIPECRWFVNESFG